MTVQPISSFTDTNGVSWLRLSNGHKIQLPAGGVAEEHWVDEEGDRMTGPLLIDPAWNSDPDDAPLKLRRQHYPSILLDKWGAPADKRLWRIYSSGPPGSDIDSDHALSFLADSDDGETDLAIFRMYRDGRLLLGANAVADMDAVTKRQMDNGYTAGLSGSSGWGDFGGGRAGMWVSRSGPVCAVEGTAKRISTSLSVTNATRYTFATMPSTAWWPPHSVLAVGWISAPTYGPCRILLETDGTLQFYAPATGTIPVDGYIEFNATYRV